MNGQKYITHHFHGLVHIADDVSEFGPLVGCSAFKFENFLFSLKKCVRKGNRPLEQVVKRLTEISNSTVSAVSDSAVSHSVNNKSYPIYESQHYSGPPLENIIQRNSQMYKSLVLLKPLSKYMRRESTIFSISSFV